MVLVSSSLPLVAILFMQCAVFMPADSDRSVQIINQWILLPVRRGASFMGHQLDPGSALSGISGAATASSAPTKTSKRKEGKKDELKKSSNTIKPTGPPTIAKAPLTGTPTSAPSATVANSDNSPTANTNVNPHTTGSHRTQNEAPASLSIGQSAAVTLKRSPPLPYNGPQLRTLQQKTGVSHVQILLQLAVQTLKTTEKPSNLNISRELEIPSAIGTVVACSEFAVDIYMFGQDPRSGGEVLPLVSNLSSLSDLENCKYTSKVEVPGPSSVANYFVVLSGHIANILKNTAVVSFSKKTTRLRGPLWHMAPLSQYRRKSNPTSSASAARVFMISSPPFRQHDELKGARIGSFEAGPLDPFCDATGTAMAAILVGKNVGLSPHAQLLPIPIYGCSTPATQDVNIRSALAIAIRTISKNPRSGGSTFIVIQDSRQIQKGLSSDLYQTSSKHWRTWEL